jgi:hypothetical protein
MRPAKQLPVQSFLLVSLIGMCQLRCGESAQLVRRIAEQLAELRVRFHEPTFDVRIGQSHHCPGEDRPKATIGALASGHCADGMAAERHLLR